MKYLKTYEGYGGRARRSVMDLPEMKSLEDIPKGHQRDFYETRDLTPGEKKLFIGLLTPHYEKITISDDAILDRISDINDIEKCDIKLLKSIQPVGQYSDAVTLLNIHDMDQYNTWDLLSMYSRYTHNNCVDNSPVMVHVEICAHYESESPQEKFTSYEEIIGIVKNEYIPFFQNYAPNCEVNCEGSSEWTIHIEILFK